MSKHLVIAGRKKLPVDRKKPLEEPGSERGICHDRLGVNERRWDKRHAVEESPRIITNGEYKAVSEEDTVY